MADQPNAVPDPADIDPIETKEWMDALEGVVSQEGQPRAHFLIDKLIGKVERAGYALVPLNLHFAKGRVKLDIGLAKGKKQFDKRATEKEREWNREKQRLMKVAR